VSSLTPHPTQYTVGHFGGGEGGERREHKGQSHKDEHRERGSGIGRGPGTLS